MVKGESRLEVAVMILMLAEFYPEVNANSEFISRITGCSPVGVRRMYGDLKKAGLLDTKPGPYGLHLTRDPHDISLWEICSAVMPMDAAGIFGTEHPLSGICMISENVHSVLLKELNESIELMKIRLDAVSLYDFAWKLPETYELPYEEQEALISQNLKRAQDEMMQEKAQGKRQKKNK